MSVSGSVLVAACTEFWHGQISALIAAQRPDADSDLIAHLMLGAPHSEPILTELASSGPDRLAAALRMLADAVLDAPAAAVPDGPAAAGGAEPGRTRPA